MREEFRYGSVYKVTREDTVQDIQRDFHLMKECGLNTVVIWPPVFYWEEKGPDYPHGTGKKILKLAEEAGLKVIMELAGQLSVFEYIPDSEMQEDYYAIDEKGNREWGQDSFGYLNYFHPQVKEKITACFTQAAAAYKDFPALFAYDVFNETMYRSFDEYTMDAFRAWLKKKYTTIERLNEVWERTYSDFSQVHYEHHKWMSIMPKADYCAFRKAAIGLILDDWRQAVRKADPVHPIIADNIHSQVTLKGDYSRPQDDFDLKNHVDEIGMSFYPKGESGVFEPAQRFQIFSGFWAASKREGFYISEMQTHTQALFNPHTSVRPYELKQWCFEAYASGAKALIYWMWRPFIKGLQTGGRGLVDYKGRKTGRFEAAKQIGGVMKQHGILQPCGGSVGIVYDPLCDDFQRLYTEAYEVDQQIYVASLYGAYKMMFDLNIPCDMVDFDGIGQYPAVILSNQLVLTKAQADKLEQYISSGGICILDGKFGCVDAASRMYGRLPGGPANGLLGQEYLDTDYEQLRFTCFGKPVNGFYSRELTCLTDGAVAALFEDGSPAVVEKPLGKGKAISVNTFLFYGYEKTQDPSQREFIRRLLAGEGICGVSSNPEVKVKFLEKGREKYVAAFNYSDSAQESDVNFQGCSMTVAVPARDVVLLRCDVSWES